MSPSTVNRVTLDIDVLASRWMVANVNAHGPIVLEKLANEPPALREAILRRYRRKDAHGLAFHRDGL